MVQTVMPMMVPMMDTGAGLHTIRLGEPLRGRAFRSNLRFAPISSAIPLASARFAHCALRLPNNRTRHAYVPDTAPDIRFVLLALAGCGLRLGLGSRCTPCLAGAGFAAHRGAHRPSHRSLHSCGRSCGAHPHFAPHRVVHRSPHQCGHRPRCLRQRAAHDCLRLRPHPPPLNRRGRSPPPPSPASIPPSLMQHAVPFLTARGGFGSHTPRSSLQGLPWVSMSGHFRDFRRLWTPGYCWIERMSHRHTLFIISTAAPGCACHPPIYAHPETDIRPTYARLSFGRHRCRRLSTTDIRPDSSAPPPRDQEIASNALYGQTPCPSPGGW